MAMLESTTPCPDNVQDSATAGAPSTQKFESRLLTVGDAPSRERPWRQETAHLPEGPPAPPTPFLRLRGRWLDQAGFPIGSKVRVEVSKGRLRCHPFPSGYLISREVRRNYSSEGVLLEPQRNCRCGSGVPL